MRARDSQVIFGINPVRTRLRLGEGLRQLSMREGKLSRRLVEVEELARERGCPVVRVPEAHLDRLTGVPHQGVALEVDALRPLSEDGLNAILDGADEPVLLLVLDEVKDPRNLGACLRSAVALGVDAVIVPKDNSAPLSAAAIKASSGGAALVPVVEVVNLARCLGSLQARNVWIVGTLLDGERSIQEVDLTGNIAIVLGAEDKGLRRNTIRHCDFLARIPMAGHEPGLNVSVATGICLYEAMRQRTR